MDKWRKKAKKAPKKHKRDPGGVESDLYAEIDVSSYIAFFSNRFYGCDICRLCTLRTIA